MKHFWQEDNPITGHLDDYTCLNYNGPRYKSVATIEMIDVCEQDK